jgi:hypothetical protein
MRDLAAELQELNFSEELLKQLEIRHIQLIAEGSSRPILSVTYENNFDVTYVGDRIFEFIDKYKRKTEILKRKEKLERILK